MVLRRYRVAVASPRNATRVITMLNGTQTVALPSFDMAVTENDTTFVTTADASLCTLIAMIRFARRYESYMSPNVERAFRSSSHLRRAVNEVRLQLSGVRRAALHVACLLLNASHSVDVCYGRVRAMLGEPCLARWVRDDRLSILSAPIDWKDLAPAWVR